MSGSLVVESALGAFTPFSYNLSSPPFVKKGSFVMSDEKMNVPLDEMFPTEYDKQAIKAASMVVDRFTQQTQKLFSQYEWHTYAENGEIWFSLARTDGKPLTEEADGAQLHVLQNALYRSGFNEGFSDGKLQSGPYKNGRFSQVGKIWNTKDYLGLTVDGEKLPKMDRNIKKFAANLEKEQKNIGATERLAESLNKATNEVFKDEGYKWKVDYSKHNSCPVLTLKDSNGKPVTDKKVLETMNKAGIDVFIGFAKIDMFDQIAMFASDKPKANDKLAKKIESEDFIKDMAKAKEKIEKREARREKIHAWIQRRKDNHQARIDSKEKARIANISEAERAKEISDFANATKQMKKEQKKFPKIAEGVSKSSDMKGLNEMVSDSASKTAAAVDNANNKFNRFTEDYSKIQPKETAKPSQINGNVIASVKGKGNGY